MADCRDIAAARRFLGYGTLQNMLRRSAKSGGGITAEFDRAIWAYCIEPFIMGPPTPYGDSPRTSELLELLLCALGSPPERRMSLKVSQKNCCLDIRNKVLETWWRKLHHLPHNASLFGLPRPVLTPRTYTGGRLGVNSPGYSSSSVPRPLEETKQPTQVPLTTSPPLTASLASPSMPVFRASAGHVVLRWEDIEILFLSDHRVQISRLGVKAEPVNYADFGFADGRNENPNLAWQTLRILAEQEGILSNEKEANARWADVEKRIQEVRKVLRSYFQISSDPILFVKDRGYVAQFRIRCSKSYRH